MALDSAVVEAFSVALATFFATIGPIDVAAMYAALTPGLSAKAVSYTHLTLPTILRV